MFLFENIIGWSKSKKLCESGARRIYEEM